MIVDDRGGGDTPSLRRDISTSGVVTGNYLTGTNNWIFFRAYADSTAFYGEVYESAFNASTVEDVSRAETAYSSGSVGVFAYQNGGGKIDNLRVRKRADPEPDYGLFGSEEEFSSEKGIINTTVGATPFFALENPITVNLNRGQSQEITFLVNATGFPYTYEFFAFANLTQDTFVFNMSAKVNISIVLPLAVPEITLLYPGDGLNITGNTIPSFNFSYTSGIIESCELFGNWSGAWSSKQTIDSPTIDTVVNFSSFTVEEDSYYIWNVRCNDSLGDYYWGSNNFTFAAFFYPDAPDKEYFNITQTSSYGEGEVTLYWNVSNHSETYKIYYTKDLKQPFALLDETVALNYTDVVANTTRRRFYRVSGHNPVGENFSNTILGKTIYYLKRIDSVGTRNWINFYLNNSVIFDANDTLKNFENLSSINLWNGSSQKRVTCNDFSCPEGVFCTETNCNFNIEGGKGYEVNLNTTSPTEINWSYVGFLRNATTVNLYLNASSFRKNWIGPPANTSHTTGVELIQNITNADALNYWDEELQSSGGA